MASISVNGGRVLRIAVLGSIYPRGPENRQVRAYFDVGGNRTGGCVGALTCLNRDQIWSMLR